MILMIRNSDNAVMNDRQSGDFSAEKDEKIAQLQVMRDNLAPNTSANLKEEYEVILTTLRKEREAYYGSRLSSVARQFGGSATDYRWEPVPPAEEAQAMKAAFIEWRQKFYYHQKPPYTVRGTKITVNAPRWVRGNTALLTDDATDFAEIEREQDFCLTFHKDNQTGMIAVELFTWGTDENCAPLDIEGKTYCQTLVTGHISVNPVMITINK